MKRPTFVLHDGVKILVVDYSNARPEDLRRRLEDSAAVIRAERTPLLVLTRVPGVRFGPETTRLFLDHIAGNAPHTEASAVVGLGHFAEAIAIANRLTGRSLAAFDDEKEALSWLASHRHAIPPHDDAVHWTTHDGERILSMTFGNCDEAELHRRVEVAAQLIRIEQPRSILAINDVSDFPYGRAANALMIEFVRGNARYMLAAAAVGLGYMKAAIPVLNRFTGRGIRVFDDERDAKDWLVAEKRRRQTPA